MKQTPPPAAEAAQAGLQEARLKRLEQLGYYLDNSIRIPGIGYRIGYDALIGLLPGVGDLVGTALSAYIVLEAARFRLPLSTVLRMVLNVGIEALVGTIPVVGDLFDATFKANARNLALVRARVGADPQRARASDRRFFGGVVVALMLLVVALAAGVILVLRAVSSLLGF